MLGARLGYRDIELGNGAGMDPSIFRGISPGIELRLNTSLSKKIGLDFFFGFDQHSGSNIDNSTSESLKRTGLDGGLDLRWRKLFFGLQYAKTDGTVSSSSDSTSFSLSGIGVRTGVNFDLSRRFSMSVSGIMEFLHGTSSTQIYSGVVTLRFHLTKSRIPNGFIPWQR